MHADLALGNAVAAAHYAELHRRAASPVDAGLEMCIRDRESITLPTSAATAPLVSGSFKIETVAKKS